MKQCKKMVGVIIIIVFLLNACASKQVSSKNGTVSNNGGNSNLIIYTTFYPMYFITSEITGDKAAVINLTPSGVEPHDWEPTPKTIARLQKADIFVYNGAGMEAWVEKIKATLSDTNIKAICTSDGIELIKPEEDDHEHDHDDEVDNHEHGDYDPHVWVSPKRLIIQAKNVLDGLITVDGDNAEYYEANYQVLKQKLEKLSDDYERTLKSCKSNTIITSHDAFGYLAYDYNLQQISIRGITPDEEPSPAKMAELVDKCMEHNIRYIFAEKLVSHKYSQALAKEVNAGILVLNAAHGLDDEELKAGETYIDIMYQNLENLKKALN